MRTSRPVRLLVTALVFILAGNLLAWAVQTGGGRIDVQDIRWTTEDGTTMSALLYVPPEATPESPAPGILAVHGYINSRETQDGFAIEFARRGWVVLAIDQTGHGYSDPPAMGGGFGGPAGLAYLKSLDMVDPDWIGLEGHSMGGWASVIAAAGDPDGYRSIVIVGSSTGTSGAPNATADFPRNMAVIFSKYDEFSGMMWRSPVAGEVPSSDKLMEAFSTTEPVEPGRLYGSIEEGTARIFHQPPVTHPADHFSREAIGHAVEWFQRTLGSGDERPASDQTWFWKEVGNLIGAVGMVLLLFPVGSLLLDTRWFARLRHDPPPSRGARGLGWWLAAAIFVVLPAATLFPFKGLAGALPTNALLPQSITTAVAVWAVLVGAISAVLFAVWHVAVGRRAGGGGDAYGLTRDGRVSMRRVARAAVAALLIVGSAYLALALSAAVFTVDFRFWVFAIKPMNGVHFRVALSYLLPFALFFVVYGTVLRGQLRRDSGLAADLSIGVLLSVLGFIGLLAYQYAPLFAGGTLADPGEALWSIIAFQFLPIMTIVALVTVYFHRQTGEVYLGAFVSALLVTWIVVASQATQAAL